MSFPASQDSFTNPSAGQPLNNPSQTSVVAAIHAALTAIETKVRVDYSGDAASHDAKIRALEEALTAFDPTVEISDVTGLQDALDAKVVRLAT